VEAGGWWGRGVWGLESKPRMPDCMVPSMATSQAEKVEVAGIAGLALRGPMLLPGAMDDSFEFVADGALHTDPSGVVTYAGLAADAPKSVSPQSVSVSPQSVGLLIPPLLDCHIHISQHRIRGKFLAGVPFSVAGGPLLAGLNRNVYPAEGDCADVEHALAVSREFAADTLRHGTLGGVAYMTSHPHAARAALQVLPPTWRVGLVLMDQNCPAGLSISPGEARTALEGLARDFGDRVIVTDRFAVGCSSRLRRAAVEVARSLGLETQTHLAEQTSELEAVARLYPNSPDYTSVYDTDGLLSVPCLLAHCVHLSDREWDMIAARGARVAHCPVANTLLGSGVMPLEPLFQRGIDYAIGSDVGASPTVDLLAVATHFLCVHQGRSARATASAALWRVTLGAKRVTNITIGGLTPGKPFAGVELAAAGVESAANAEQAISRFVLGPPETPAETIAQAPRARVRRVFARL
jgi:guanine deaminase